VLERAGLITRSREAQWRPCRFEPGPLAAAEAWAERTRAVWRQRLDRLEAYLQELTTTPQKTKESSHGRQPRRK
jgi:hypothetical protein